VHYELSDIYLFVAHVFFLHFSPCVILSPAIVLLSQNVNEEGTNKAVVKINFKS